MKPLYEKSIIYDVHEKDFAMYINGELAGYARTYQEAETKLDEIIYNRLKKLGLTD